MSLRNAKKLIYNDKKKNVRRDPDILLGWFSFAALWGSAKGVGDGFGFTYQRQNQTINRLTYLKNLSYCHLLSYLRAL